MGELRALFPTCPFSAPPQPSALQTSAHMVYTRLKSVALPATAALIAHGFSLFQKLPHLSRFKSRHGLILSVSRTQGLSHVSALLGRVSMHHFSKIYVASVANPWPVSCLLSLTGDSVSWGPGPIFFCLLPSTKKYPRHSSVVPEHEKARHATPKLSRGPSVKSRVWLSEQTSLEKCGSHSN